jgi:PleD family two-component response regulator
MARKILNVGADEEQVKLRDKALASAGYSVVSATNLLEVIKACEQRDIDLAILGHVPNVNEKSRITATVRSTCKRNTPVLALYQTSPSEADDADAALAVQEGTDALVKTVTRMLESRKKISLKRKARATH